MYPIKCRFCDHNQVIKSGIVRNKQRYKCKGCAKHFVIDLTKRGLASHIKLQAFMLLKEGMSFRAVSRILQVSLSAVLKWFKQKALIIKETVNHQSIERIEEIDVVEIDEMWHYTPKKQRKIWIWLAVSRATKKVLAIEVGSRGRKTLKNPTG